MDYYLDMSRGILSDGCTLEELESSRLEARVCSSIISKLEMQSESVGIIREEILNIDNELATIEGDINV